MRTCVTITIGGQSVAMSCNALTRLYYKHVFGKNLMHCLRDDVTEEEADDMVPELAYIMAMDAAGADMSALNRSTYMDWLRDFGLMDFYTDDVVLQIRGLIAGNQAVDTDLKKSPDQQIGS